jgi:hypothetical protein
MNPTFKEKTDSLFPECIAIQFCPSQLADALGLLFVSR